MNRQRNDCTCWDDTPIWVPHPPCPIHDSESAETRGLRNIVETTEQGDYMPKYLPPGLFGEN